MRFVAIRTESSSATRIEAACPKQPSRTIGTSRLPTCLNFPSGDRVTRTTSSAQNSSLTTGLPQTSTTLFPSCFQDWTSPSISADAIRLRKAGMMNAENARKNRIDIELLYLICLVLLLTGVWSAGL